MTASRASLLCLLCCVGLGCRSLRFAPATCLLPTQKDVLLYRVDLPQAVAPEDYVSLADASLRETMPTLELEGGAYRHPTYREALLYEVQYSFHCNDHLLATVVYRIGARDDTTNPHPTTRPSHPRGAAQSTDTLARQHTFIYRAGLVGTRD